MSFRAHPRARARAHEKAINETYRFYDVCQPSMINNELLIEKRRLIPLQLQITCRLCQSTFLMFLLKSMYN